MALPSEGILGPQPVDSLTGDADVSNLFPPQTVFTHHTEGFKPLGYANPEISGKLRAVHGSGDWRSFLFAVLEYSQAVRNPNDLDIAVNLINTAEALEDSLKPHLNQYRYFLDNGFSHDQLVSMVEGNQDAIRQLGNMQVLNDPNSLKDATYPYQDSDVLSSLARIADESGNQYSDVTGPALRFARIATLIEDGFLDPSGLEID